MKLLTIYTNACAEPLKAFASEAEAGGLLVRRGEGWSGDVFRLSCAYEPARLPDALAVLLEYAAVQAHPIYKHSVKLKALAKELSAQPVHMANIKRLKEFLKRSGHLNIEGYVTFRMTEYRDKLDAVMFSVIKRLRLT